MLVSFHSRQHDYHHDLYLIQHYILVLQDPEVNTRKELSQFQTPKEKKKEKRWSVRNCTNQRRSIIQLASKHPHPSSTPSLPFPGYSLLHQQMNTYIHLPTYQEPLEQPSPPALSLVRQETGSSSAASGMSRSGSASPFWLLCSSCRLCLEGRRQRKKSVLCQERKC
jgi:hypothetical protein